MDKKKKIKFIFKKTAKIGLKILLWVQVGLLSIVALFGIIGCINDAKTYTAKADSVSTQYSFVGSNLWTQVVEMQYVNKVPLSSNSNNPYNFRIRLQSSSSDVNAITFVWETVYSAFSSSMLSAIVYDTTYVTYPSTIQPLDGYSGINLQMYPKLNDVVTKHFLFFRYRSGETPTATNYINCVGMYTNVILTCGSTRFSPNIVRVEMGAQPLYQGFFAFGELSSLSSYYYNYVRYADSNGNTLEVQIPVNASSSYVDSYLFESRTYFLNSDITSSDEYWAGYNDGVNVNTQDSFDEGYEAGKKAYEGSGYNKGYADGLEAGSGGVGSLGWFFQNALSVLDVKIFGFVSLGDLFKLVVGVSLVLILLKIFAGG